MIVREGVIPASLGTVVTAAGATLAAMKVAPLVSAGVVGFGLAHMLLGTIDIVQHRADGVRRRLDDTDRRQIVALNEFS